MLFGCQAGGVFLKQIRWKRTMRNQHSRQVLKTKKPRTSGAFFATTICHKVSDNWTSNRYRGKASIIARPYRFVMIRRSKSVITPSSVSVRSKRPQAWSNLREAEGTVSSINGLRPAASRSSARAASMGSSGAAKGSLAIIT